MPPSIFVAEKRNPQGGLEAESESLRSEATRPGRWPEHPPSSPGPLDPRALRPAPRTDA